ncbi:MAG: ribonuclease HII [Ferruginibacter sp.]|nr:ribonuclease HII [Cytophagales bacterium]
MPSSLKPFFHPRLVEAGLDEVGRGCLAGPVVAAVAILPPDYHHWLLNDSKQLSRGERESLRAEIEREAFAWAVAEASPVEIDTFNILQASLLAMHRAVDQLTLRPEHLLVDGNRFNPYPFVPHTCVVKGDATYFSIAAASVLAKTYRDARMEALAAQFPHYGWERNVGYPTAQHRRAIREWGTCEHHRKSFRLGE